jgi:hypothetical protein
MPREARLGLCARKTRCVGKGRSSNRTASILAETEGPSSDHSCLDHVSNTASAARRGPNIFTTVARTCVLCRPPNAGPRRLLTLVGCRRSRQTTVCSIRNSVMEDASTVSRFRRRQPMTTNIGCTDNTNFRPRDSVSCFINCHRISGLRCLLRTRTTEDASPGKGRPRQSVAVGCDVPQTCHARD